MDQVLYVAAALAAITAAVAAAARRLDWPAPVLLVVAGLALALTPGLPRVELPPDLVLLVLLPPIIYTASFGMSWQAFCANLRPIVLLAVGCVVATTIAVAAAAHWLVGMAWSVAFVLGAIVSPPDVVAPLAIARRLGIPFRISAVLEGEGLVNDATALVLFEFALAAVITGSFSLVEATATFGAVVAGETLYGLAIGWTMLWLRRLAGDPRIEVTLSLLTPYLAFWVPRTFGGSGVLATVVAGLYVGSAGVALIRSSTRLPAVFVWDFVTYLITGAIFLLTGLQARTVLDSLGGAPLGRLVLYGLAISLVAIAVRFLWVFSLTYLPRWLVPPLARRDPAPAWPYPFMIAFTGVRGVVSLAAALSIPFAVGPERPFPDRGLILFLTFSVIVVTLVLQGPTLSFVVRRLGLVELGRAERRQREAQQAEAELAAARTALDRLGRSAEDQRLPAHVLEHTRRQHERRIHHLERRRDLDGDGAEAVRLAEASELAMLAAEREHINKLARLRTIPDEVRRRIERDLDLREERLRHNVQGVSDDEE
ncbi:Na+/H+ antiporter [Microvirga massiliensis]|uniref:Na+/H+ antiporter n=1 Tax=Microvirga massiliensis TaxID=1033741 RepID=UPI00062B9823|nr:Na+/H+ antiporter [Microvirga massiliensis]